MTTTNTNDPALEAAADALEAWLDDPTATDPLWLGELKQQAGARVEARKARRAQLTAARYAGRTAR